MRKEQYRPQLSDRENRAVWEAAGASDARVRATAIARQILDAPLKPCLPEAVRHEIIEQIPGIRPFLMT